MKILVVDDDPRIRSATATALGDIGHVVTEAEDGAAALAVLATGSAFDLMISDVLMPQMTGPALARAVAAFHPALPILFISGDIGTTAPDEFGGREVLAKPFTLSGLTAAITRATAA